ncbi:MAG TPA: hypothetical protein VGY56_05305 [Verrucomicrobiae bacterium]|nr:hypothetical protein [Verrucomicrobiae bacterium]
MDARFGSHREKGAGGAIWPPINKAREYPRVRAGGKNNFAVIAQQDGKALGRHVLGDDARHRGTGGHFIFAGELEFQFAEHPVAFHRFGRLGRFLFERADFLVEHADFGLKLRRGFQFPSFEQACLVIHEGRGEMNLTVRFYNDAEANQS